MVTSTYLKNAEGKKRICRQWDSVNVIAGIRVVDRHAGSYKAGHYYLFI